jgi:DNA repair exonuclease SbcCD nuclease subunit
MKIAITADVHLKTKEENPERYNALINILDQLLTENINNLIIAGDLFDINSQNYSIFDELCKQKKYNQIQFYIIPGNHDSDIKSKYFTANNIKIFNEPTILALGDPAINFFFIPYIFNKPMGEIIASFKDTLPEPWLLIGHGDYLSGMRDINTYESSIYMLLSRTDIEYYEPVKVILGHIHKKTDIGKVHYSGSPCGMDINETGKKSFLILDLNSLDISEKKIETDYIFFSETLIALPTSNEFDYIKNKITDLINKWNLSKDEIPKARIRLRVKGYISDRKKLESAIKEKLKLFTFYNDEEPDLTEVSVFNDPERISIVERVKKEIDDLEENLGYAQLKKDYILEQALHIILRE